MITVNRNIYGTQETNGLVNGPEYHAARVKAKSVDWTTKGLRVTRLRLLTDPGINFLDVSYCHGMLNDEPVDVILPFSQLMKRNMKAQIVEYAKKDGVFARSLGLLDNISILN